MESYQYKYHEIVKIPYRIYIRLISYKSDLEIKKGKVQKEIYESKIKTMRTSEANRRLKEKSITNRRKK